MEEPKNEDPMAPRPASASRSSLSLIALPGQANPQGVLHGGVMLRLADECGGVAALRHVGRGLVLTAAIDSMVFLSPVQVGELIHAEAEVTHVGRTSIESRIEIFAESPVSLQKRKVAVAYALYVSLEKLGGKPRPVRPLLLETEADRRRDEAGAARQAIRLARRAEARNEASGGR